MSFRIIGLDPTPFRHLFGLPDQEFERLNVKRVVAERKPGYPDRAELLASGREVEPAIERLLENPAASYIHAHYAKRGCYAARIDRA
jgi:hypothetical protein